MPFSHSEETRNGRTIDWLEDYAAGLRVGISRFGAELISIQRRDPEDRWIGFLHRDNDLAAPKTGWANHATVMGFYLHRLNDERSLYRGHEMRGGTHSFARTKNWHVIEQRDNLIRYRITPEDFSPTEYPLNVSLQLSYLLESDNNIRAQFRFVNAEPQLSAHVAFGLHPGFAASSFDSFEFRMPAGFYRRYFSPGNFLSGETQDVEFGGGPMPFNRQELPGSFILELVHLASDDFVFEDRASRRLVTIRSGSAPYLTLWSDGGAFLCVEPCWGLTDAHNQRAFEDKLGIRIISPKSEMVAECAIRPTLL